MPDRAARFETAAELTSPGPGATLAIGMALAVLARVPELVKLPVVDQANFMLLARELWAGKVLYRDLFDVKPPMIYWLYAALGAGGAPSYLTVVGADLALTAVTLALLHAVLARWMSSAAHRDAVLWLGLVMSCSWFSSDLGVLQPETVVNVLVALVFWLARDGRPSGWLVGLLALAAGLTKILPAAVLLGVAVAATVPGRRAGVIGRVTITCAAGVIAFLVQLHAVGALPDFREAMAYAAFQRGILVMAAHNARAVAPAWALPAVLAIPALALRRNERAWLPLVVWLGMGLGQVVVQGKFYSYHFLALIPPLALLAGWGAHEVAVRLGERAGPRFVAACVLAQLGLAVNSHLDYNSLAFARLWGHLSEEKFEHVTEPTWEINALTLREAAAVIEKRTQPHDAVFTFGIVPQLYLLSGRALWGPYVFHYGLLAETVVSSGFGDLAKRQARFLEAFDVDPPKAVVVPDSQSPVPGVMQTARELTTFHGLNGRLLRDYDWIRVGTVRLGFRKRPVASENTRAPPWMR